MQTRPASQESETADLLLTMLADELGPNALLSGADIQGGFVEDWARDRTGKGLAVVRPGTVDQLSRCLSLCAAVGVGIIPQGGHTGLVGGAQSEVKDCVIVSTSRMNGIREIDPDNMTAIVEAGVVLETLQEALAPHGLEFPVSIGAQGTAQIGGLVSTNAGGVQVVRHGMTGNHVLGLELVMADGTIMSSLGSLHKDNRGPDPLRMAIGGEGVFGVLSALSLKLVPRVMSEATAYVGCGDFDSALALLKHLRGGAFEFLTGFEVMSQECLPLAQLVDLALKPPFEAPVHIVVRLGSVARLPLDETLAELLADALDKGIVSDVVVAQSGAQAAHFWALREGFVEGHGRRGYHVRSDVSVKIGDVPKLIAALTDMLTEEFPDWLAQAYGHMGDGNLHFNALPPEQMQADEARTTGSRIEKRIFEIALAHNGSYSAEHGIGRTKRDWLARTTPQERLALLARIKAAFDPGWTMNPDCLIAVPASISMQEEGS